jgi:chromosome segregation ATPase
VIAEHLSRAHERIAELERELIETKRQLERTENARQILLDYYERHKKRIQELEDAHSALGQVL